MTKTNQRAGFVTLVGRPNVGKSTLMNRILGKKIAIATSKPQTTRNRILGVSTVDDNQICFIDTPGLHRSSKRLNKTMVKAAIDSLEDVDAVVHVIDAAAYVGAKKRGDDDELILEEAFVFEQLSGVKSPVFLALNKVDIVNPKEALLPLIEELGERYAFATIVPVSAETGENVDVLVEQVRATLPESEFIFPEDVITDKAEAFLCAEFVRERVMHHTRKEIPYAVAVEIERFYQRETNGLIEISALIYVERDSQKGIVIGDKGSRIKAIGTEARRSMETFFGTKVHLETFVRVSKGWTDKPHMIHKFGYDN